MKRLLGASAALIVLSCVVAVSQVQGGDVSRPAAIRSPVVCLGIEVCPTLPAPPVPTEPPVPPTEAPVLQSAPQIAPERPVVVQSAVQTDWPTSLDPCGGDLPPCYVKYRESHGDYSARNNESPSSACGAWQIIQSTWNFFAGYPDACSAPPAVQDEKARQLWTNGAGCSHWSAC